MPLLMNPQRTTLGEAAARLDDERRAFRATFARYSGIIKVSAALAFAVVAPRAPAASMVIATWAAGAGDDGHGPSVLQLSLAAAWRAVMRRHGGKTLEQLAADSSSGARNNWRESLSAGLGRLSAALRGRSARHAGGDEATMKNLVREAYDFVKISSMALFSVGILFARELEHTVSGDVLLGTLYRHILVAVAPITHGNLQALSWGTQLGSAFYRLAEGMLAGGAELSGGAGDARQRLSEVVVGMGRGMFGQVDAEFVADGGADRAASARSAGASLAAQLAHDAVGSAGSDGQPVSSAVRVARLLLRVVCSGAGFYVARRVQWLAMLLVVARLPGELFVEGVRDIVALELTRRGRETLTALSTGAMAAVMFRYHDRTPAFLLPVATALVLGDQALTALFIN